MAIIHFILQGKGGVGKSLLATLLYQYLAEKEIETLAFDTDPINATFASFQEFNVKKFEILEDHTVDLRKLDPLLEDLAGASENSHAIVDNGSTSFSYLCAYIGESNMINLLREDYNHTIYFHSIVTGGQSMTDTIANLIRLAKGFPSSPIIVWCNPYFGEVQLDGRNFEQFKVYTDYCQQFKSVIRLPLVNRNLVGKDLEELFAKRHSFKAGINGSLPLAQRSRLKTYWERIVLAIDQSGILE